MKAKKMLWLKIVAAGIAVIVAIHILSMLTLDRTMQYVYTNYTSNKVDETLDGYKIAFVTDTHLISDQQLLDIVTHINDEDVDLFLLGGDHPTSKTVGHTMEILSTAQAKDGIFGVEGNHDSYKALFEAQQRYGIHPLDNTGTRIRQGLYLGGVQDLWNRTPDAKQALRGSRNEEFKLLLSHNPDYAMHQEAAQADLILSGHTHGGQITFFGVWAPALSARHSITDYGQRFMTGFCKGIDNVDVYVSNGSGFLPSVPRLFARPQVIFLTLRSAK